MGGTSSSDPVRPICCNCNCQQCQDVACEIRQKKGNNCASTLQGPAWHACLRKLAARAVATTKTVITPDCAGGITRDPSYNQSKHDDGCLRFWIDLSPHRDCRLFVFFPQCHMSLSNCVNVVVVVVCRQARSSRAAETVLWGPSPTNETET